MARILKEDVAEFVEETLLSIRTGMQAAAAAGIVFPNLPKEISFTLDIVQEAQSLIEVTETEDAESAEETEDPTEDVEETVRDAADDTTTGGGDIETATYTYGEYTE